MVSPDHSSQESSSPRNGHRVSMLDPSGPDTFVIAIATDNHLGYMERDPVRGKDSFDSFEEFLQIAVANKVDFILLGGDLFHDNKPSRSCLYKTMSLLRKYCMGDGLISIEYLSDESINFPDEFATANYIDPNYNVKIPVFTIHGNHDDPSGVTISHRDMNLCALDLLSVSGLVNYFGKQPNADNIVIDPILLGKGRTKLALYGLGNIRDERLNQSFHKNHVRLLKPVEHKEEWFNLMVIHQNRIAHSAKGYIPEKFLSSFVDLVFWGHEHECRIDAEFSEEPGLYITQPGSSVATSLSPSESIQKHVGILRIQGRDFHIEKIPLKTVRPFVMDTIELSSIPDLIPTDQHAVNQCLRVKVESLIEKAKEQWKAVHGNEETTCPKPLIRLKVEYSGGFTTFNPHRFGQPFVDLVANPTDILLFYRKKVQTSKPKKKRGIGALAEEGDAEGTENDADINLFVPDRLDQLKVEDLVSEYLNAQELSLLPENEFSDAVRQFVEKEEKEAIKTFVDKSLKNTQKSVSSGGNRTRTGTNGNSNNRRSVSGDNDPQVLDPERIHVVEQMLEDPKIFELEVLKLKQERVHEYEELQAVSSSASRPSNKTALLNVGSRSRTISNSTIDDVRDGTARTMTRASPRRSVARTSTRAPKTSTSNRNTSPHSVHDADSFSPIAPDSRDGGVHIPQDIPPMNDDDYMDDDDNEEETTALPPLASTRNHHRLRHDANLDEPVSTPGKRKRALPGSMKSPSKATTSKRTKATSSRGESTSTSTASKATSRATRAAGLKQMTLDAFSQSTNGSQTQTQASLIHDSFGEIRRGGRGRGASSSSSRSRAHRGNFDSMEEGSGSNGSNVDNDEQSLPVFGGAKSGTRTLGTTRTRRRF